jgi:hypothetical protein
MARLSPSSKLSTSFLWQCPLVRCFLMNLQQYIAQCYHSIRNLPNDRRYLSLIYQDNTISMSHAATLVHQFSPAEIYARLTICQISAPLPVHESPMTILSTPPYQHNLNGCHPDASKQHEALQPCSPSLFSNDDSTAPYRFA